MRTPLILLSALLFATAVPAAVAQGQGGKQGDVEIVTSSDWDRVVAFYKHSQGGAERFDGLRTMSFDFTPAIWNEAGEEVSAATRHITYLLRPDSDEQEVRAIRIETEVPLPGGTETAKIVSIVTAEWVKVWAEDGAGGYSEVEARELQAAAVFDAQGLWAQLDLILFPDTRDLRCSVSGPMTRNSKRYMAVEAEFRPGRKVPEPARLYFSAVSSLIERMDVFDPKTHLRTATTYLEDYKDHDGIKFPHYLRMVDRSGEPIGSWSFTEVKMNPKLPVDNFKKP